jgi:serine/threonine-protein kinase
MSTPPPARTSSPPAGLPGPGDVIAAKYRVERVIGAGGMGAVLAARHIELDERVAIKMLLPHLPVTGEASARFLREAKAAIRIKNEHVVRVLDVGRTGGGAPYIVMEFLEGCDLGQLLEHQGPLSVEDTVLYVTQACEAIAAAHAMGIVHRDLKPANLFLTTAGDGTPCVKVLDFGISKLAEPSASPAAGLTSTATVMGTPCFMSPEQLRSTRDVDARADIWSLGAILHALLTGTPPYDGESNADVSAKIIRDAPIPLRTFVPEAPADLEALVLRCLEKDPARRFQDVVSLAAALSVVSALPATKASATRVARIAAAVAPTVPSIPPPEAPARIIVSDPGPTRTASNWGDTRRGESKREEKRSRRVAGLIAAAGVVAGIGVFGVLRLTSPHPAPASVSAAAAGQEPVSTVTVPAASVVTGTAAASASVRTPTPAPAPETTPASVLALAPASAHTLNPALAPAHSLHPGRATPSSSPAASAGPPSSKPPAGTGLFDGRE